MHLLYRCATKCHSFVNECLLLFISIVYEFIIPQHISMRVAYRPGVAKDSPAPHPISSHFSFPWNRWFDNISSQSCVSQSSLKMKFTAPHHSLELKPLVDRVPDASRDVLGAVPRLACTCHVTCSANWYRDWYRDWYRCIFLRWRVVCGWPVTMGLLFVVSNASSQRAWKGRESWHRHVTR